jgi:Cof subfamily protein (haloacid dehalogenase superfamily)
MKLQLAAFDLDGTLLRDDKSIAPATAAALREADRAGVLLVPVSGRLYDTMPREVLSMPFLRYAIAVNGAEVYDVSTMKVLREALMTPAESARMFAYLKTLPAIVGWYQDGHGWMAPENFAQIPAFSTSAVMETLLHLIYRPMDGARAKKLRSEPVQKLQVYFKTPEEKKFYLPQMLRDFPDYAVSSSIANNIEVNSQQATKGSALRFLCEYLHIPREACAAFGDGTNDTSMLQYAGFGVAMGNAAPEVLAAADIVAKTNEQDGLAETLRELLKKQ